MKDANALTDLERLEPGRLHLFVAGPGTGEGVAVAFPGRGWLLIDGCRGPAPARALPLGELLDRFRRPHPDGDPVWAMVLTHPHADHVDGFVDLLERHRPQWVCVTGCRPPGPGLLQQLKRREADGLGTEVDVARSLSSAAAAAALRAIARFVSHSCHHLVPLHAGQRLPIPKRSVFARAPLPSELEVYLEDGGLPADLNLLSAVIEIGWGNTRLVLGSDLPKAGWESALPLAPQLVRHAALKIPHHGSLEALHDGLIAADGRHSRAWLVTPKGSKIPDLGTGGGVAKLLAAEPSVLLTALPTSKTTQPEHPRPGRITLSEAFERRAAARAGHRFLEGAVEDTPPRALEPLDAVWCVALDERGAITGRWRGPAATEVIL